MLGGPDGVEPERLDELAQVERVVHVRGVRHRGRAAVVLRQEALPVALVVAGHHHAAVHAVRLSRSARVHDRSEHPRYASSFLPRQTLAAGDSVMSQHDPEKRHRRDDMPDVLYVGMQDDDRFLLFRQSRPQQHRRLRRRPSDRASDRSRACAARGGPHRVRSRFDGDISVLRGNGIRTSRLVPSRR